MFIIPNGFILDVLRVIRNGLKVKETVDDAIDQCGDVYNLRDSIETFRMHAEEAMDARQKHLYYQRGKRYAAFYFHDKGLTRRIV